MLLVVDNRDSFTWNLVQLLGELGARVRVERSSELDLESVLGVGPERVLVGPGPGSPGRAGASEELVRGLAGRVPVLGVCLGHQAIATAWGGRVVRSERLLHGRTEEIHHDGRGVFEGLPLPFRATRYHSLTVDEGELPDELEVSARSDAGEVMGLRHREHAVEGVQFHPESILSESGRELLANFLAS
jgi:anthranilate synthase/aminodeoxychorismate synthase-like glutamine amidotransferase